METVKRCLAHVRILVHAHGSLMYAPLGVLLDFSLFFLRFIYLFYVYEYIVALQVVESHHVVARN